MPQQRATGRDDFDGIVAARPSEIALRGASAIFRR
jgi:hypothetical protein